MKKFTPLVLTILLLASALQPLMSQQLMERLGRGIVALNTGSNKIYVGWRFLGNDPSTLAFNLYKSEGAGAYVKVNNKPMVIRTDTTLTGCNLTVSNSFYVKAVLNGVEQEASSAFTLPAATPVRQYVKSIPMQDHPEESGITTSNAMPGDLDGDGEPDLVVMRIGAGGDTARMMLESYKLDGTYLWRFEFGKNINQSNEHNAQAYYVVYDFDGDGKAEVCVRGSERSIFQAGSPNERMVGDVLIKDGITLYPINGALQRPSAPEYLYMLDGATGRPLDSIKYEPAMGPAAAYNTNWGGNERPYYQWMSVAYLDGKFPSIVTQRGIGEGYWFKIYGFDFRNGKFKMRSDSLVTKEAIAFGGHSIRIKDIDNDGKDEVLFTGAAVDHNMKLIYNQASKGIGHGDGYQIMDMDPDRPGLEWFAIQQGTANYVGAYYWDAATGEVLKKYYMNAPTDPSRGDAAPICPNIRGAQMYGGTQGVMTTSGSYVNKESFIPCGTVFWDADLAKELIENANSYKVLTLKKYDPATGNSNILFNLDADGAGNATMAGATYYGDLMGDWREEIVAEATENSKLVLRIYTTTTQSNGRYYTLLHNRSYRTQLTSLGRIGGFYPDFYFGPGMTATQPAPYFDEDMSWSGDQTTWDNGKAAAWLNKSGVKTFTAGNKVLFDDYGITGTVSNKEINITENVAPGNVVMSVYSDYILKGSGAITGTTELLKEGKGSLTINSNQSFTGNTNVWDGALIVNGTYNSPVTVYGGIYGGYRSGGLSGGRIGGAGKYLQSITLAEKGGIVPGNAINASDTFRISQNLTMKKWAYLTLDMGATPSTNHDIVKVNGDFTVEDTVYVVIKPASMLAAGKFPLIQYGGTFKGTLSKMIISGLENQVYSLENTSGIIQLVITDARTPAKVIWGGVADKWEKTTAKSWYLNTQLDSYSLNDSVVFNDQGIAKTAIQLTDKLPVSDFLVDSKSNFTFSGTGSITGTGGLTKRGPGKLSILTNNSFTGNVKLDAGKLEVLSNVPAGQASPLGAVSEDPANFLMSNSLLQFSAPIAMGFERGITISGNDTLNALNTVAFSGLITGSGKLVKTGAGKICFTNLNTFTGGTYIKEGTLTFSNNTNPLGTGLITMGGGRMTMCDNDGNTETFSAPIDIPAGITANIDLDSRMVFSSTLTGSGILNLWSPYVRADLKGNWSAFSGTINVTTDTDGGDFRITNSNGYANALVTLASKVSAYPNGTYSVSFGSLSSTAIDASATTPFTVGNRNTDATFAGIIKGTGALTKTGTGSWTINNVNTYTGATSVDGGTLMVENTTGSATGSGAVTVKSGATLGGSGIMSGTVNILSGGTISAGTNTATGSISIGTNLVITTGGIISADVNADTNAADVINVTGTSTLTGAVLKINKLSGTYNSGDSFKLINCPTITAGVSQVIPETPGSGLKWDLSVLSTTGTIKVATSLTTVKDVALTDNIRIYPNPCTDKLNIGLTELKDVTIRITDISGLLIYQDKVNSPALQVSLAGYPRGLYLVEVIQSDNSSTYKVVKI